MTDFIKININNYEPHPRNSNTHPDEQINEIDYSLEEFGQYKNVVVWNGRYLTGHGVVEAARKKGLTELWAKDMSHLTAQQAEALMESDNQTATMSIIDEGLRAEVLSSLEKPPPGFTAEDMAEAKAAVLVGGFEDVGDVVDDPFDEWVDMPEFENEDNFGAVQTIKVHFASDEDRVRFAELMGQTVTDKTKSIWYPKKENEDLTKYVEQS